MITEIKIFLFILSIVFILRIFIGDFVLRLFEENPEPLSYDSYTKVFLYLALSYTITFLILI